MTDDNTRSGICSFDFEIFLARVEKEPTAEEKKNQEYLELARALDSMGRNPTPRRVEPWRPAKEIAREFYKNSQKEPEKLTKDEKSGLFTIGSTLVNLKRSSLDPCVFQSTDYDPQTLKKEFALAFGKIEQIVDDYLKDNKYDVTDLRTEYVSLATLLPEWKRGGIRDEITVSSMIMKKMSVQKHVSNTELFLLLLPDSKKSDRYISQLITGPGVYKRVVRADVIYTPSTMSIGHIPIYEAFI